MILANQHSAGAQPHFPYIRLLSDLVIQHTISVLFFESKMELQNRLHPLCLPRYKEIMTSFFHDAGRPAYHDSIYLDILPSINIALHISRYILGFTTTRLLYNSLRVTYSSYTVPLSKKWREETPREQANPMKGGRRRPSYDGRFSTALPLPLTGQTVQFSRENRSKRR